MSKNNHSYPSSISNGEHSAGSRSERSAGSRTQSREEAESGSSTGPRADRLQTGLRSSTVLVGIPVYNEAATIGTIVADALVHADEVLVVDDGSDDGTREQARAAGATLVSHDDNRGYGAALKTIFRYAYTMGVEQLVILDGDGQHDVNDVPDILDLQRETGAEIVTGSRFRARSATEMPLYRQFGLAVINLLTNLGLRIGYSYPSISDTQCGFRAYNRDAIEAMATAPDVGSGMGASIDILFQAAREGFEVVEIPTKINYDVDDANTQNPIAHGFELLVSLFVSVSRDRPVRMTGAIILLALSGGGIVLTLGHLGTAGASVILVGFLTIVLLLGVTLSGRFPIQSDSTER